MKDKDIAQRILAMYHGLGSDGERKQFLDLLKDIISIIEKMNREDFVKFVDDFEKHLDNLDDIKSDYGIHN